MSTTVFVFSAEEARVIKAMDKIIAKEAAVRAGLKKTEEQSKKTEKGVEEIGEAGDDAFGAGALGDLASYAGGFVSIGAAVSTVTRLLEEMRKAAREAQAETIDAVEGLGPLAQTARNSAELDASIGEAEMTFAQGATPTLREAGEMQQALINAGFEAEREFVAELKASNVVNDPVQAINAAQKLQTAFGKDETGDFKQIISKAFAASEESAATAEQVLAVSPGSAGMARRLGLDEEQILAALGVLTKQSSPEEAATQLESMLAGLSIDAGYEGSGLSLDQMITDIQSQGLDTEELKEMLGGRKEGLMAFDAISQDRDSYRRTLQETYGAHDENRGQGAIDMVNANGRLGAAQDLRRMQNQRKLGEMQLGDWENLADAALEADLAGIKENYGNGILGQGMAAAEGMGDWMIRDAPGVSAIARMFGMDSEAMAKDRLDRNDSFQAVDMMTPEKRDALQLRRQQLEKRDSMLEEQRLARLREREEKAAKDIGDAAGELKASARELKAASKNQSLSNAARQHQAAAAAQ